MNEEIWRSIESYALYEVSDLGHIRSRRGWGGRSLAEARLLTATLNHDGYPVVSLTNSEGGRKQHMVHRLVAAAFIGPRPDGYFVAHGNGIRSDIRAVNLRYATATENEADKRLHGTIMYGEGHPRAILSDAVVDAIRREYADGATQVSLGKKYRTHHTNVSLIVRGKAWAYE